MPGVKLPQSLLVFAQFSSHVSAHLFSAGVFSPREAGEVRGRFGLGRQQPPLANNRVEMKEVGPDPRLSRRGRPVVSPKPTGPVRPLARLSRERARRKPRIKPGVAASTAGSLCVSGGWPSAGYSGDGLAQSRPSD